MNHYVSLSLTNMKSSVHLHALYSPRTALRTFTPRRDQLVMCSPGSPARSQTGRLRFDSRHRRKDFSSNLYVHTGSGAHPASCTMGTGGPFPGGKVRPVRDADHSHRLVTRSRMSRSYISSSPKPLRSV
jgi:hypothetical protein